MASFFSNLQEAKRIRTPPVGVRGDEGVGIKCLHLNFRQNLIRTKMFTISIPTVNGFEALRMFKNHGYNFIKATCDKYDTNLFHVNALLKDIVCMTGKDAAALFYDPAKFERMRAIPKRVQKTLLGEDGVQTLDGERHRVRKAMFMSLMTPQNISMLMESIRHYWTVYTRKWEHMEKVVLFHEAQEIFCRAACEWAGVPLHEHEVRQRADDFTAMVDAFGAMGLRHWRGKTARSRTEEWIMGVIDQVHQKKVDPAPGTALHVILSHAESGTDKMDKRVTAVEIINILRPIVAIAYYVTFAAHALHLHPGIARKLQRDDDKYLEHFTQEVRRFYPFAPFTGAMVKDDFEWNAYEFEKGTLVFLDIYGTNHDPDVWDNPEQFVPERFETWNGDKFNFIPQGGGDYASGHRCAGERITIEAMKLSVAHLARKMTYDVPDQDLSFSLTRLPTYPESGFVIDRVTSETPGIL